MSEESRIATPCGSLDYKALYEAERAARDENVTGWQEKADLFARHLRQAVAFIEGTYEMANSGILQAGNDRDTAFNMDEAKALLRGARVTRSAITSTSGHLIADKATDAQKARAFEWLRSVALGKETHEPRDSREGLAALAFDEWHRLTQSATLPTSDDPDRAEFLREAQKQLAKVLEGDIGAVMWMAQAAADYHDYNESGADAMGMPESAEYHRKQREALKALASPVFVCRHAGDEGLLCLKWCGSKECEVHPSDRGSA